MAPVSQPASVEFVHEDAGRVTARHVESGVASFGDDEAEAPRRLSQSPATRSSNMTDNTTRDDDGQPADDPLGILQGAEVG